MSMYLNLYLLTFTFFFQNEKNTFDRHTKRTISYHLIPLPRTCCSKARKNKFATASAWNQMIWNRFVDSFMIEFLILYFYSLLPALTHLSSLLLLWVFTFTLFIYINACIRLGDIICCSSSFIFMNVSNVLITSLHMSIM